MGCCGDASEEETEKPVLFRDLPEPVLAVRRIAFSALRREERLDPEQLALRTGRDADAVHLALGWLHDAGLVEQDADDRVVGIAGLALEPTKHRLVLDGRRLHTWCAIDAVGIPAALSLDAHVTTTCEHCGASLSVDIDHGEPPSDSPLRGWIPPTDCDNVRAEVCPLANLFCSEEHLTQWRAAAGNPHGQVADLERFAELGRHAWGDLAARRTNMSETTHYDLAIVGSGSAAFATAIEARRKDASVVMIEHGTVGGTCVNVGCIPSKALLAAADARHVALDQHFPGIATTAAGVDMAALVNGKDAIVDALRHEKYEELAGLYGFDILYGHARFVVGPMLEVNGEQIVADRYVMATGSSPWVPPIPGLDETGYLTSTTAMELDHVPTSLVVIGGGFVGLEQGQLFSRLGSAVALVVRRRIAPVEEPEISEALTAIFSEEGIGVRSAATVSKVVRENGDVVVSLDSGSSHQELRAEAVLVATGRRPNTTDIGLDAVGVTVGPRGEVVVDDELRSTNPRIFAAGDVTGHPQFVYVAGKHGAVVADNAIDGAHRRVDYRTLPRVTFTSPAIASVGMTEAEANAQGLACTCRVLPLTQIPRAIVNRDTRGVAKIVAERASGRVLGVHLLAEGAGDAILAAVYALEGGFTVEQLATAWTPYLTMAEAIKLTAQSFTREVGALSCCAS